MIDTGFFDDFAQNPVDGMDHDLMQTLQSTGLFGIYDTGDDVLPIADLAVKIPVFG